MKTENIMDARVRVTPERKRNKVPISRQSSVGTDGKSWGNRSSSCSHVLMGHFLTFLLLFLGQTLGFESKLGSDKRERIASKRNAIDRTSRRL